MRTMQIAKKLLLIASLFAVAAVAVPHDAELPHCVCVTSPCPCDGSGGLE